MAPTKYTDRSIPKISLWALESRIDEITADLVRASETDGFFVLVDHGIPPAEIDAQFRRAEQFFSLPDEVKGRFPFSHRNAGWEKNSQVRPSTGVADRKESYQMQFGELAMRSTWPPADVLPGWKEATLAFMREVQALSERLMVCFAKGLGLPDEDYFVRRHDVARDNVQTVLRLLHYFALDPSAPVPEDHHRAGAHADWDFLTLLFQRQGQSGLEICPGREALTEFGAGDAWTKVEPREGEIVCNIGDLLMRWSDDRFKSTLHRVRTPRDPETEYFGPRYSMAFFNQPNSDCVVRGPLGKYPPVTGAEFTKLAMRRNFAALEEKKKQLASSVGSG